jgi:hypothetical protein
LPFCPTCRTIVAHSFRADASSSLAARGLRFRTADYAGACHRAALCADPLGSNPPYRTDLPDRLPPTRGCQALFVKIFCFSEDPNHLYISRRPAPPKGRIAVVTDAGRDAVDAGGASDEGAYSAFAKASADWYFSPAKPLAQTGRRTAKPCGPGTPTLVSSLR